MQTPMEWKTKKAKEDVRGGRGGMGVGRGTRKRASRAGSETCAEKERQGESGSVKVRTRISVFVERKR
jgi:hypothetical protein